MRLPCSDEAATFEFEMSEEELRQAAQHSRVLDLGVVKFCRGELYDDEGELMARDLRVFVEFPYLWAENAPISGDVVYASIPVCLPNEELDSVQAAHWLAKEAHVTPEYARELLGKVGASGEDIPWTQLIEAFYRAYADWLDDDEGDL